MQAQTLNEVIRVFDPRKTLDKEDLDEYYAFRILNKKEDPAITKLKVRIFGADAQKILFSGHRGCGKSTELNKLALDLEENHQGLLIVKYNVTDVLNVFDLDYSDILFSLAYELYHKAESTGVKIDQVILNEVEEFVGDYGGNIDEVIWMTDNNVLLPVMDSIRFEMSKRQREREDETGKSLTEDN